ncbi:MAG: ABC transporter permease [Lachnospiraceae bacterium]|jgi:D-methionine transport system permease protein|nr:ABC transporter permease [Lachnospiraceae bacterium]
MHITQTIAKGFLETLEMTGVATAVAYILGLPLGVLLAVTGKNGIAENRPVSFVLGSILNIARSIPFLILLVMLIPFTRLIVGTSLGTEATIVPLTVGTIPIVARMVEQSLHEVNPGVIEAAQAMGAGNLRIVKEVLIPEAGPSLLMGVSINIATVLGYSAMAGFVGGGGLGDIAIQYGYYRYETDILLITVAMLVIIVQFLQSFGERLTVKIRH